MSVISTSPTPLGGRSGVVREVDRAKGRTTYLIVRDGTTVKRLHAVYSRGVVRF